MRLVLEYTESDGCTYSATHTLPVIYADAKSLVCDFEKLMKEAYEKSEGEVDFAEHTFWPEHFFYDGVYYGPSVMTLDEWFENKE